MKKNPILNIPVRKPFHLGYMTFSHGFIDLPPFAWDKEGYCLDTVVRTKGEKAFALRVESEKDNRRGQKLRLFKAAGPRPDKSDLKILEERIRWSLRLDEDFAPFRALCGKSKELKWVKKYGLGAFLRCPDLFEEFTKVLITTNINWAGTKNLNRLLLAHLGQPLGNGSVAFPPAQKVASCTERYLREKIRLGYRAPYLKELAKRFAGGKVDADAFMNPDRPLKDLMKELGSFKGFGPYAVNTLLITFGRYELVILDSWIRRKVAERYFKGRRVDDARIRRLYSDKWGKWAGLGCWFECIYDSWFKDELRGQGRGFVVNS